MTRRAALEVDTLTIRIPIRLQRRGGRKLIMMPEGAAGPTPRLRRDETLIKALVRAHRWRRKIESGQAKSITDLAEQEGVTDAYICRLLPLTCLAPDIVLLAFDVGLHVARRHQPDIVPECPQLSCPIVPGGTRLDADPTGLDRREERQHPGPPQTSPNHHPTVTINAVHLEHRLCYVHPDNHYLSHRSPPCSSRAAHAAPWMESRPRHQKLTLA